MGETRGEAANRRPERNNKRHPQCTDCVRMVHLIRDFQKCVDRGGPSEALGQSGLAVSRSLFAAWKGFGDRSIDREELRRRLAPLRERLRADLEGARASPDRKVSTFATN